MLDATTVMKQAGVTPAAGDELAMHVRCVVEEFGGPLSAIADHFEADWPTRR